MSFRSANPHSLPLVSIIVNNFNYDQFLEEAINSALEQTYLNKEIIVVDDGSTDNSLDIIFAFGQQVTPVLKKNEGQASAFNAGFSRSRGDIVVFLDADDLLMPRAVESAVPLFKSDRVVKAHWPLLEIDSEGKELGTVHRGSLIDGDYRDEFIRRGPVSLPQSPTSGNAWARWFLEKVIPLPEHEDKHGADGFLRKLCPIYGTIRRVVEPQGFYRIHTSNYAGNRDEMFRIRSGLNRYKTYCRLLAKHLRNMGIPASEIDWMGKNSQYAWLENYVKSSSEIQHIIPAGERLILIDNQNLGDGFLPGHQVSNFGSPNDDNKAIAEIIRHHHLGIRWVVIAFPAFWWLDSYKVFFEYLGSVSDSYHESECVMIHSLREKI